VALRGDLPGALAAMTDTERATVTASLNAQEGK